MVSHRGVIKVFSTLAASLCLFGAQKITTATFHKLSTKKGFFLVLHNYQPTSSFLPLKLSARVIHKEEGKDNDT